MFTISFQLAIIVRKFLCISLSATLHRGRGGDICKERISLWGGGEGGGIGDHTQEKCQNAIRLLISSSGFLEENGTVSSKFSVKIIFNPESYARWSRQLNVKENKEMFRHLKKYNAYLVLSVGERK